MNISNLQKNWDRLGSKNPFSAILTSDKNKKLGLNDFFDSGKREVSLILDEIKLCKLKMKRGRALDFGCGVGRATQALAGHFDEVIGVDIAPSMIELANKLNKCPKICRYSLNEKDNLGLFESNSFDFVYSNITLQHMPPEYSKRYIKEFVRITKPGGLIVFELPYKMHLNFGSKNPLYLLKQSLRLILPQEILNYSYSVLHKTFSKEPFMEMYFVPEKEVIRIIKNSGARLVKIKFCEDNVDAEWIGAVYFASKPL